MIRLITCSVSADTPSLPAVLSARRVEDRGAAPDFAGDRVEDRALLSAREPADGDLDEGMSASLLP
jgi:hypothetical protein